MEIDYRQDAWFSGLAAGEGSFLIRSSRFQRWSRVLPEFHLCLRADDSAVLADLRRVFGGKLRWRDEKRGNGNPVCAWWVYSKAELLGLVDYFDKFPLRAKKARDYAIWREAVLVYSRHSSTSPELEVLRLALAASREFDQEVADNVRHLEAVSGG